MLKLKTVEVLQISAGLAAALRWAIALMPLDGLPFALSSRQWFEPVSFALSLTFAAVEIGATAYIMRAWRLESDKRTQAGLMWLWIVALVLMVAAQVPPILANINAVAMTAYPFWVQAAWAICGVSVTFVVIGGVGYAEKSIDNTPQSRQNATQSVFSAESDLDSAKRQNAPQSLVFASEAETPSSDWQAAHLTPLADNKQSVKRDLTDSEVLQVWRAHGQADAWQSVKSIADECLNGQAPRLQAWYGDKRSVKGLCEALGITNEAQARRIGSLVRKIIKPVQT